MQTHHPPRRPQLRLQLRLSQRKGPGPLHRKNASRTCFTLHCYNFQELAPAQCCLSMVSATFGHYLAPENSPPSRLRHSNVMQLFNAKCPSPRARVCVCVCVCVPAHGWTLVVLRTQHSEKEQRPASIVHLYPCPLQALLTLRMRDLFQEFRCRVSAGGTQGCNQAAGGLAGS